ncbi:MAG: hypothetical protein JEY79_02955 [Pseudodesulfovibrio sp.]|nr:hypothetical protein [Pseudodesulfovibrio sp.]
MIGRKIIWLRGGSKGKWWWRKEGMGKKNRKREPATPAAWLPKFVIALPAEFVSFSKAKKKEPKKSAFF